MPFLLLRPVLRKKTKRFWVIPKRNFLCGNFENQAPQKYPNYNLSSLKTIFFCSGFLLMMHWFFKIITTIWRIKAYCNYSVTGGKGRLYFCRKKTKTQHECCEIQKWWKPMTAYETCLIKICSYNCSCQKFICDKYPSATSTRDILWWVSLRSP